MTTREYQEAYDDDSDQVRAWQPRTALESLAVQGIGDSLHSAQDAQEPSKTEAELEEGVWFLDDQNRRLLELLSAQDAKCVGLTSGSEYLRSEIVNLKAERDDALAEVEHAWRHVDEAVSERDEARTERDEALAAIARVEALATQWEQLGPGHYECAAQLLQAMDESVLARAAEPTE